MSTSFHLKRALVTGAGKGIGRGIALRLANMGAKVHAISRTDSDLESLRKECGDIEVYNVDIMDWDKTRSVVKNIGPIDFLVNNAGVTIQTPFMDVTKNEIDTSFDTNFKAVVNISQVIARGMIESGRGGSIVNISSLCAQKVFDNVSMYSASKAALDMLTRSMAAELGPHKIRVNSILPGLVVTPLSLATTYGSSEASETFTNKTPLKRLNKIDDIVDVTVFLLSDQAAMVNGLIMPVDGGYGL